MKKRITNNEQKSRHCGRTVRLRSLSGGVSVSERMHAVSERSRRHPQSLADNTSPNPSKGGEQAVRKMNLRKQLPLFRRGLGGGDSLQGIPASAGMTAGRCVIARGAKQSRKM